MDAKWLGDSIEWLPPKYPLGNKWLWWPWASEKDLSMMINRREISFKWLEDVYAKRLSSNGWMMDPPRDSLEMAEWRIRQANLSKFLNDGSAKRVSSNAWIMDQPNLRMMDPPSESLQMPEWWIRQDTLNADSAEELRRKVWYAACTKRMSDSPYSVIISRHSLFSDFCDLVKNAWSKKRDFFNGNFNHHKWWCISSSLCWWMNLQIL